ncbi:MAG TPA: hypothetical protein PKZ78_11220 [Candidatus Goldiibacteriota bacterium]|nr:hypothetical protein [Candidatus Goldiibacteriota bacterium]
MPDPVEYEVLKDVILFKGMSDSELEVVSKKVFFNRLFSSFSCQ